jgi:hypothetical protein
MKKEIKLTVSKPCSQNWNDMEQRDKAHFCASCQQCVKDFTTATDSEIIAFVQSNTGSTCGRFNKNQLDRVLNSTTLKSKNRFSLAASLLFLTTIGNAKSPLETSKPTLFINQFEEKKPIFEHQETEHIENDNRDSLIIEGKVFGIENSEMKTFTAPYAIITLKDTDIKVVADEDGYYKIVIPSKFNKSKSVLVFYSAGLVERKFLLSTIPKGKTFEVGLGEQVLGDYGPIKYSLWRRFLNLFR